MAKKSTRELTFHENKEFDPEILEELNQPLDLDPWSTIVLQGILNGVIVFILTLILVLIARLFSSELGTYYVLQLLVLLEITIFWFASAFVIWFGPSPSIARFKSRLLSKSVFPISTTIALRHGARRFISGSVLFLLIGI